MNIKEKAWFYVKSRGIVVFRLFSVTRLMNILIKLKLFGVQILHLYVSIVSRGL